MTSIASWEPFVQSSAEHLRDRGSGPDFDSGVVIPTATVVDARRSGKSSPFGRALDEIADTIALIMLVVAMTYRLASGWRGAVLACLMLGFGGLCANAWDFYRRKIIAALREGRDRTLEEI